MNLHEYQAKDILRKYGLPIPPYGVAGSVNEAQRVIDELQFKEAVVKIQVHAGGRGKAGGVKIAKSGIADVAGKLIGMKMVNQQTGPEGVVAHKVMITELTQIEKEFYIGVLMDRDKAKPVLIASPAGGMEIEEQSPDKILKMHFEKSLKPYQLMRLNKFMGWSGKQAKQGAEIAQILTRAFLETDAAMLEINPLVQTPDGDLVALDAKLSIDDNALFRHPEMEAMYDPTQVTPQEAAAKEFDLAYIAMDGTIGCMVNGAGLAMATMDIIKLAGGSPANFLDVGGGASKEKVAEGFRIILSDKKVKAILVNIFGGIMSCATIALGVVHAAKELGIKVPIVVRLEGNEVEEGRRIFADCGLKIIAAKDLKSAAELVVRA